MIVGLPFVLVHFCVTTVTLKFVARRVLSKKYKQMNAELYLKSCCPRYYRVIVSVLRLNSNSWTSIKLRRLRKLKRRSWDIDCSHNALGNS
jgi:hypothetical protein